MVFHIYILIHISSKLLAVHINYNKNIFEDIDYDSNYEVSKRNSFLPLCSSKIKCRSQLFFHTCTMVAMIEEEVSAEVRSQLI